MCSEIVDALLIWAKYIYGPLTDDRVRLIEGFDPGSLARGQREILKQIGVPEAA